MKKENVTKFSLEAAFKALDEIEAPRVSSTQGYTPNRVNLHERLHAKSATEVLVEDFFDLSDQEDLNAASEEREAEIAKAKLARIEKIVDLDAESEDDILPSYVGKFIIQCPQCMTLFYKNEEDVEMSEETPDTVNVNEVCQHCGNTSGYTLVGKVGSVEEDEMSSFDLEDTETADENAEEATEEPAEEATDEEAADEGTVEEGSEEDNLDLDLDLDLDLEEEEVEESLHKSKLLADIEKKNELKTEEESSFKTLNEEIEEDGNTAEVEESIHNSKVLSDIEKKNDLKTDIESDYLTLNENAEEDNAEDTTLNEDAVDTLLDELWSGSQPTEEETKATLASFESLEPDMEASLADVEDFDENSFNEHFNKYLKNVYSNVKIFEATSCTLNNNQLVLEGKLSFKSGKSKHTSFIFEQSTKGLLGSNKDFAEGKSFLLKTAIKDGKLITEGLKYRYRIGESLVRGTIKR